MELKGIFLDTNVFVSSNFNYTDNKMQLLVDKCDKFDLSIYINDIVKYEVYSRIHEKSKDIVSGIENKKLKFMSNIFDLPNTKEEIRKRIEEDLLEKFDYLLTNLVFDTIPSIYNQEQLLKMYFDKEKPFEEKKKHEFPDAIIGLSVKDYASNNGKIILVTNDDGLSAFCKNNNVATANYISEAISLINKEYSIDRIFKNYKNDIKDCIADFIQEENGNGIEFNIYGYYYDDDIYAENYNIKNIIVNDIYLLEEDDENQTMTISCDVVIHLDIETDAYMDYQNGIFDKEDNQWITFSRIISEFEYKKSLEMEFFIQIEDIVEKEFILEYKGQSIDIQFDSFELEDASHTVLDHVIEYK
ncbi:MAG: PIN domain-containing protein [Sulfurovum sp.]|nr:PIN domain-containing protein [Sulfurovum sp.]